MKTIKIACDVAGVNISSVKPSFKYTFIEAGRPLEIPENHAKKILKNSDFYISDKHIKKVKKVAQNEPVKEKPWLQELEDVKGIGEKGAKDIVAVYPVKGSLLEAISKKAHIPFPENIVKLLKKEFIH